MGSPARSAHTEVTGRRRRLRALGLSVQISCLFVWPVLRSNNMVDLPLTERGRVLFTDHAWHQEEKFSKFNLHPDRISMAMDFRFRPTLMLRLKATTAGWAPKDLEIHFAVLYSLSEPAHLAGSVLIQNCF